MTADRRIFFSGLLMLFLGINLFAQSEQKRGPSTPEERSKAVQIAHALEADPLQSGNKDMRTWFTVWLIQIPDITIQVCGEELGPVFKESNRDKNFVSEIFGQSMFSAASFVITYSSSIITSIICEQTCYKRRGAVCSICCIIKNSSSVICGRVI